MQNKLNKTKFVDKYLVLNIFQIYWIIKIKRNIVIRKKDRNYKERHFTYNKQLK